MFLFLAIMLALTMFALIGGTAWLIRFMLIVHPKQEQESLELYSVIALSDIISRYPHISEEQQRLKAEQRLRDIFTEKGLTLTGDTTISAAIGWATYKKQQEEHDLDFERLKTEIKQKHARIDRKTTSISLVALKTKKTIGISAPSTPKLLPSGEIIL
jgi:hypothetical protein